MQGNPELVKKLGHPPILMRSFCNFLIQGKGNSSRVVRSLEAEKGPKISLKQLGNDFFTSSLQPQKMNDLGSLCKFSCFLR